MMGCILIFGFVLVGIGISQGWDGLPAILSGVMVLWFAWDMRPGQSFKINSSVDNKIIAHDGNGRYLVQAKTSRQIIGPRPHVQGNLPAHLLQVDRKNGLWVVDASGGYSGEGYDHIKWKPVSGNYRVSPRGEKSRDFLNDAVLGYQHNYIQKDK
jgi:hypothetical protein